MNRKQINKFKIRFAKAVSTPVSSDYEENLQPTHIRIVFYEREKDIIGIGGIIEISIIDATRKSGDPIKVISRRIDNYGGWYSIEPVDLCTR